MKRLVLQEMMSSVMPSVSPPPPFQIGPALGLGSAFLLVGLVSAAVASGRGKGGKGQHQEEEEADE